MHGRRKDFSRGRGTRGFFQIFPGGDQSGEIWFLLLDIEKQPFLVQFSKSRGPGPPSPSRRPRVNVGVMVMLYS